jgi:hypothetical protein
LLEVNRKSSQKGGDRNDTEREGLKLNIRRRAALESGEKPYKGL